LLVVLFQIAVSLFTRIITFLINIKLLAFYNGTVNVLNGKCQALGWFNVERANRAVAKKEKAFQHVHGSIYR